MKQDLYETDFHAWTQEQAERLRAGLSVDRERIAEELLSLGGSEQNQLRNRLAILLMHMLKWEFQPDHRSPGWQATLKEQRRRIAKLLEKMPSLRPYLDESIMDAYETAVSFASVETGIIEQDFPRTCPYGQDEILGVG